MSGEPQGASVGLLGHYFEPVLNRHHCLTNRSFAASSPVGSHWLVHLLLALLMNA